MEKILAHEKLQSKIISSHANRNTLIILLITLSSILLAAVFFPFINKEVYPHPSTGEFFSIFLYAYLLLQWIAALRSTILAWMAKPISKTLPDEVLHSQFSEKDKTNKINAIFEKYGKYENAEMPEYDYNYLEKLKIELENLTRLKRYLLHEITQREVNEIKRDNLEIGNRAINNYLWGLLFLTIMVIISTLIPSSTFSCIPASEIIQSPKQITTTPTTGGNVADSMPVTFLIALAATFATLGAALLFLGKTFLQKIIGGIMFVAGLTFGVSGKAKFDTTLFKLDSLIGNVQVKLGKVEKTVENTRPYYTFIRKVVTVGPFPDGEHLLDARSTVECVRNALALYDKTPIGGWEVIGRVDKRQLKPQPMGIYGSNQALAMARASWVVQKMLMPQPIFNVEHTVMSVGGAQGIGISVGANDMQSDRAVDVFAMVNSHNDKDALAALPKPVICP